MNYLLKPLGYNATIKQENVVAVQLERNRMELSSNRIKHNNVWYFYIVDRLKVGNQQSYLQANWSYVKQLSYHGTSS